MHGPDLKECGGCKDLGICCKFPVMWPSVDNPVFAVRSDIACPFLAKNGMCGAYPLRHHVPWCDYDAEKHKGTDNGGMFPSWCPHSTPDRLAPTIDELFQTPKFKAFEDRQKEAFRATINQIALDGFLADYPEWGHLLAPDGSSTLRAKRLFDPPTRTIDPRSVGPETAGA